jgi:hypothetical protein
LLIGSGGGEVRIGVCQFLDLRKCAASCLLLPSRKRARASDGPAHACGNGRLEPRGLEISRPGSRRGYRRKQGKPGILPQTRELIALSLGTPVIYSEIADRVALLDDPYPVVIFYAKVAEARSIIGSPWEDQVGPLPDFVGRTLACLQDALQLARPIVAGEIFGGKRLDQERRQHTTAEIDKCLGDVFGIQR